MQTILRMYEESQRKLEDQIRENTTIRLKLKEYEMSEQIQLLSQTDQPQDLHNRNSNMKGQNDKLKNELKAAYCEIAELKQALAMKERKIGSLQQKNAMLALESSNQMVEAQELGRFSLPLVERNNSANHLPELNNNNNYNGFNTESRHPGNSVFMNTFHSPPQRHKKLENGSTFSKINAINKSSASHNFINEANNGASARGMRNEQQKPQTSMLNFQERLKMIRRKSKHQEERRDVSGALPNANNANPSLRNMNMNSAMSQNQEEDEGESLERQNPPQNEADFAPQD